MNEIQIFLLLLFYMRLELCSLMLI